MTTVTKTDLIGHEGVIDGGTSYNVPPDNKRCCLRISLRQLSLYWLAFTGTLNLPTHSHSSFIPYVG